MEKEHKHLNNAFFKIIVLKFSDLGKYIFKIYCYLRQKLIEYVRKMFFPTNIENIFKVYKSKH